MHIHIYYFKYLEIKCLTDFQVITLYVISIIQHEKPVYMGFSYIFLVSTSFIVNIFRFNGSIYSL